MVSMSVSSKEKDYMDIVRTTFLYSFGDHGRPSQEEAQNDE